MLAQSATVELSIATEPALAVAATAKGEEVLSVSGGSAVQLVVTAHHADASQTDVTAGATYRSLAAQVVTVTGGGLLQFGAPSGRRAAAVVVEYGGLKRVVAFQVEP